MWSKQSVRALIGVWSVCAALAVQAAPASPQTIEQLVELQNPGDTLQRALQSTSLKEFMDGLAQGDGAIAQNSAVREQAEQMQKHLEMVSRVLPPAGVAEFEALTLEMLKVSTNEFRWEKTRPHLLTAYAKLFSEEEAQALLQLYATPVGRAAGAKWMASPQYVAQTSDMQFSPEAERKMKRLQAQLQALDKKYPQPKASEQKP